MAADDVRDELAAALVPFIGYSPVRTAALRALLPVVDRIARETAGKALRDAATELQGDASISYGRHGGRRANALLNAADRLLARAEAVERGQS